MQLLTTQKKFYVPSICISKQISGIISEVQLWKKKDSFLVLTSGNFLEALGSRIGTGSIFCLSFWLSNRVSRAGQQNIFFFHISAWFQYRNITQKCKKKTSCCTVARSRQTFWFEFNILSPENESVLEHFRLFSWKISKKFLKLTAFRKSVKLFSNIP